MFRYWLSSCWLPVGSVWWCVLVWHPMINAGFGEGQSVWAIKRATPISDECAQIWQLFKPMINKFCWASNNLMYVYRNDSVLKEFWRDLKERREVLAHSLSLSLSLALYLCVSVSLFSPHSLSLSLSSSISLRIHISIIFSLSLSLSYSILLFF